MSAMRCKPTSTSWRRRAPDQDSILRSRADAASISNIAARFIDTATWKKIKKM
jgi:hypothetical protein